MTTRELMESLGVTKQGVYALMDNLTLGGVPVYQPGLGLWTLLRDEKQPGT
jgi:hypothetical protein